MVSKRIAGILIPLFSIRRFPDHGIGDLWGLMDWLEWAHRHHIGFLQLLPVNALGSDISPYSALSSVALEPLYLALDSDWIPGLTENPKEIPNNSEHADYARTRQFKDKILRDAWNVFQNKQEFELEWAEFETWKNNQSFWLDDFACYMVLTKEFGTDLWWQWSIQDQHWAREFAHQFESEYLYHIWLQWLLSRQWKHIRETADHLHVKLMGDLPIGVSMASSDVYFQRHNFNLEWSCGSPPEGQFGRDPFSAKWGQNWGIPLLNWASMENDNYLWWHERLRGMTKIFHMIRLDHVLGFYRIYAFPWKPWQNEDFLELNYEQAQHFTSGRLPRFFPCSDDSVENRRYNLMFGDKNITKLFSPYTQTTFIAEDLGATPDYVRPNLRQHSIPGIIVPQWTTDTSDHAVSGLDYHPQSFATFSTHDHPPLMTVWEDFRIMANSRPSRILAPAVEGSQRMIRIFCEFGNIPTPSTPELISPWNAHVKTALFQSLFESNSNYVALMFNDLFDIPKTINIPGQINDENWRVRMNFTAESTPSSQSRWLTNLILTSNRIPG